MFSLAIFLHPAYVDPERRGMELCMREKADFEATNMLGNIISPERLHLLLDANLRHPDGSKPLSFQWFLLGLNQVCFCEFFSHISRALFFAFSFAFFHTSPFLVPIGFVAGV